MTMTMTKTRPPIGRPHKAFVPEAEDLLSERKFYLDWLDEAKRRPFVPKAKVAHAEDRVEYLTRLLNSIQSA